VAVEATHLIEGFSLHGGLPERMRRIGVLLTLAEKVKASLTAFQEELQQLGWAPGRNAWIDYRLAGGDQERLDAEIRPISYPESDQNAESRTHNQHDTGSDVMQIARAFVTIAPSGPTPHDPCRCPHIQKDGSGIDDQTSPEGHAAETKAVRAGANISRFTETTTASALRRAACGSATRS